MSPDLVLVLVQSIGPSAMIALLWLTQQRRNGRSKDAGPAPAWVGQFRRDIVEDVRNLILQQQLESRLAHLEAENERLRQQGPGA